MSIAYNFCNINKELEIEDPGFYPILPRCKETLECLILANYTARKFDSVPGNNHKPYLQKKGYFQSYRKFDRLLKSFWAN